MKHVDWGKQVGLRCRHIAHTQRTSPPGETGTDQGTHLPRIPTPRRDSGGKWPITSHRYGNNLSRPMPTSEGTIGLFPQLGTSQTTSNQRPQQHMSATPCYLKTEQAINFQKVQRIPYTHACTEQHTHIDAHRYRQIQRFIDMNIHVGALITLRPGQITTEKPRGWKW